MEDTVFYCPVLFYMCLLIRCLGIDIPLLLALAPARMCLPIRYPATDVSSDFNIPAFGRHVTALMNANFEFEMLSVNRLRTWLSCLIGYSVTRNFTLKVSRSWGSQQICVFFMKWTNNNEGRAFQFLSLRPEIPCSELFIFQNGFPQKQSYMWYWIYSIFHCAYNRKIAMENIVCSYATYYYIDVTLISASNKSVSAVIFMRINEGGNIEKGASVNTHIIQTGLLTPLYSCSCDWGLTFMHFITYIPKQLKKIITGDFISSTIYIIMSLVNSRLDWRKFKLFRRKNKVNELLTYV
jgi:hypothetical protein